MLINLKHGWIFVKPHSWKKTSCIVGGGVQPGFFLPTFSTLAPMAQNLFKVTAILLFTVWKNGAPRKSMAYRRDGEGDHD
jgi:hypothetical protein